MDSPKHALRTWIEWELDEGSSRPVLVVETDLPTTPGQGGRVPAGVDEMIEAALQMESYASLSITKVRVAPSGAQGS